MINKLIEEQIFKAALTDIDIEALAKKFKPQIQKSLEKSISDFIKDYDFYEVFYEDLEDMLVTAVRKHVLPKILANLK